MMRWIIIVLLLLLSSCTLNSFDASLDPEVLESASVDKDTFVKSLEEPEDYWAKGDYYLILARLKDKSYYKDACDSFKSFIPETKEEEALLYETLGSLGCGDGYYIKAAQLWQDLGLEWRSTLLESLDVSKLEFETSEISPELDLSRTSKITIGDSSIVVNANDVVATQNDRVLRDWLGLQIQNPFNSKILKTFSERLTYTEEELMENIGWHEGGRLLNIMEHIPIMHVPITGTIVAKHNEKWYAPDEKGIFRFEVPLDKVFYPTTRFFSEDIAMIIDTHGMNMVVEQSIRNNVNTVIACCDHPGKVKAALYLSNKNISTLCFPDLYVHKLLGLNSKTLGSPPYQLKEDKVIFGNSPITLHRNQMVVVANSKADKYALWYYQSPFLYFNEITKHFPLRIHTVMLTDFNQASRLYTKANQINADVVATRIFNKNDYIEAKKWLQQSQQHKIILFHSTAYPYGVLLSQEFKRQISFNDPNPKAS